MNGGNTDNAIGTKNAWKAVDDLFPTDYERNDVLSVRAGYPVYTSTAAGCGAWISDLGDRLEVNMPDGSTVNVWIMPEPPCPERQIDDALSVVDEALYQIDDNILPAVQKELGIDEAYRQLYAAFRRARDLLAVHYPGSELIKKYNLNEA